MKQSVLAPILAISTILALCAQELSDIDTNFRTTTVGKYDVNYFDALSEPFEVTGFAWWKRGEALHRLPSEFTTDDVSDFMLVMSKCTSGGAIRFQSDSPYIALRAEYGRFSDMSHMPRSGSAGFDLFAKEPETGEEELVGTVFPGPECIAKPVESCFEHLPQNHLRTYTLYLPLYSSLTKLEIGFKPGSRVIPPPQQKMHKPIAFYGSSITQGACASRPANNYTTMICRKLDCPQINLGFSGVAQGEIPIAKALGELDLAAFVFDYDYNAPDENFLKRTHEPFFRTLREAKPDLPIIILSRCTRPSPSRRAIIRKTYENAIAAGDRKVWFIDGEELFGEAGQNFCRVDSYHPNDLGFYMMFKKILPVLEEAIENK